MPNAYDEKRKPARRTYTRASSTNRIGRNENNTKRLVGNYYKCVCGARAVGVAANTSCCLLAIALDTVPERLDESALQTGPQSRDGSVQSAARPGIVQQRRVVRRRTGPVRRQQRILEPGQVGLHAGQLILELVVRVQVQAGLPSLLVHRDQVLTVADVRHQVFLRDPSHV